MALRKQQVFGLIALSLATLLLCASSVMNGGDVMIETQTPGYGEYVSANYRYKSHVTLYLDDEKRTPSGWSTRKEHGSPMDQPFIFQPGVNLITGWTAGVLQMQEGERALLHVPANMGYGPKAVGDPDRSHGGFYVPPNSNLLFDIEILEREGSDEL